ncbi:phage major capsid protein [Streptomyces albicerus]|uniref:phage major capsid protein n=1 Tax=Streptomyces albicerus TaxID=2569859 RepID=UPI00124B1318|nr:phage major capsid protein [Streptomyces albicerus]
MSTFDPFTASVDEIDSHIAAASTPELMDDMREIDARAGGGDLAGSASVFYHRAHARVMDDLNALARAGSTEDGTPFTRGGTSEPWQARSQTHDRALRTVDSLVRSGELPAYGAQRVEKLLNDGLPRDRALAARWAVAAGDPAYSSAFARLLADSQRGHMLWTPEEHAAFRRASGVHDELRALSTADSAGGYMIPLTLDPAIILTNDGSTNPLRAISRVVQTTTGSWKGVTSAGTTAEWKAEAVEVAEPALTVGQPDIPVHFGDVFSKYSFEVGMDAVDLLGQLRVVLADAAAQLQNTAYTTGTGTGQPKGLVTALAGTASEINTTGTEALVATDPYALQNALGPRFQGRAQWMAALPIINTFRQFETGSGALKFPELRSVPPQLLGRAMNENSNMDGTIVTTATANNYVLVYGDFSQFVIVDRIGSSVELIQNMLGANRRPTAERGVFLYFRTGSDVTNASAFRLLDVPTTA